MKKFFQKAFPTLIGIIIILALLMIKHKFTTPYAFLESKNAASTLKPTEELYQTDLHKGLTLLFYANAEGNLCHALIQDNLLFYDLVSIGGDIPIEKQEGPIVDLNIYSYSNKKAWLAYGIIHDASLHGAFVNNQEASIMTMGTYSLFFTFSETRGLPAYVTYNFTDEQGRYIAQEDIKLTMG